MTSLDIPIDMRIALLKDSPNEKGVLGYKCKNKRLINIVTWLNLSN